MKTTNLSWGKTIFPIIFFVAIALILMLPIIRSTAANPTLTNADFETGPFNTQGTATGWTATAHAGAVDFEGGTNGTTHAGALSLGGDFTGDALSQSFNTTSGASYTLAFDAGIFGRRDGGPLQVEVQVTGTGTLSDTTITPPDAGTWTASQVQFSHFTVPFTANSATTTIKFIAVGSGNANADQVIDTVSVVQTSVSTPTPTPTATPSPSSTVCAAQGAVADACYAIRPPPCTSGQAFWFPNADCNIPEGNDCLNPGSDPSSGTDGFKYIFTAASGNTTPTSGTFTENANGTATLTGHLESTLHPGFGFDVNITWTGRTTNPNLPGGNGPLLELKSSCYSAQGGFVNPATWHFYQNVSSATLTGTGTYAGAIVQLIPVMHFFQVGDGASGKNINSGASGWFSWVVLHQPNDATKCIKNGSQVGRTADFNFNCTPGCTGQIGDFVWQDTNQNGCQDPNEPGIPNVQVDLFTGCGANKVFRSTQMTDQNGHYLFTGLCAGQYSVSFHTPNGFAHTVANATCSVGGQPSDSTDSDCTCTGTTSPCDVCVTLPTDSSVDTTIDCGYIPICTGQIGDFVWQDTNQNGCQDTNEPGIPNVQVDLFSGCDANKTLITTQMTDQNGHYLFTNLCAGQYSVSFHTPTGFTHTIANATCNINGQPSDSTDSDCTCTGTTSPCDVCVTLPTNSSSDTSVDCGYIPACSLTVTKSCATAPAGGASNCGSGVTLLGNPFRPAGANFQLTALQGIDTTHLLGQSGFSPQVNRNFEFPCVLGVSYTKGTSLTNFGLGLYAGPNNVTQSTGLRADFDTPVTASSVMVTVQDFDITVSSAFFNPGKVEPTLVLLGANNTIVGQATPSQIFSALTSVGNDIWNLSFSKVLTNANIPDGPITGFILAADMAAGEKPSSDPYLLISIGGASSNCVLTPGANPDCTTEGHPTSLTFQYTGGGCGSSNNPQSGKFICSGSVNTGQAITISTSTTGLTVSPTSVSPGGFFTVSAAAGKTFPAQSLFSLSNSGGTENLSIHTSCSQVLTVGNVFGDWTLVAFNGHSGGNTVNYHYTVTNNGSSTLSDVMLTDDKLGTIAGPFSLTAGQTKSFDSQAQITQNTTNTATASAQGGACSATSGTVTVTLPSPTPTPTATPQTGNCTTNGKPNQLKLTYTGGSCAASMNSQGPPAFSVCQKFCCTEFGGGLTGTSPVHIIVSSSSSTPTATSQRFFEGDVALNTQFTVMSGSSTFQANTYIFTSEGGVLKQKVQLHTSCSAPLIRGETFGGVRLDDYAIVP